MAEINVLLTRQQEPRRHHGRPDSWRMKMSNSAEIVIVPDEETPPPARRPIQEDGIEVPLDRINPDTLRNLISEFVTREWEEIGDAGHTLEAKIEQVRQQLKEKKARVVFDLNTQTCNIVTR